jgi:UDP-N-acetylglucosamine--dolichyl-phosphate N-acetylglucosaminephosphotransferase
MVFLGFVDDVVDVRWRVKIPIPAIASLPLLLVYFVTKNVTTVIVPTPLIEFVGSRVFNLGKFVRLTLTT